jgi:hypothetical protein
LLLGEVQESTYTLRGALSAGPWTVSLRDFVPEAVDYRARAQLFAGEQMIVEMELHVVGTSTRAPFGETTANGSAVAGACGKRLLLRLEVISGLPPGQGTAAIARVVTP